MPTEIEESTDVAHEIIKEESANNHQTLNWINWVALSTLIMALFSALGALMAGISANNLLVERTKEILEASHLESDRVAIEVLKSRNAILAALGKAVDKSDLADIRKYQDDVKKFKVEAIDDEAEIIKTIFQHELFAIGVTILSLGITMSGISVITKRKNVWIIGLVFGVIGTGFVWTALYKMLL